MQRFFTLLVFVYSLATAAQGEWSSATAEAYQKNLNKEYADKEESPLTPEDLKTFTGLAFYPISEKYAVKAQFIKSEKESIFKMKTTGNRLPEYVKYGELHFTLDGKPFQLNVYQNIELIKKEGYHDYLFLPFSDLSCGQETYIGGRYIDLRIPKGDMILLDFNTAYNPYCAYNHKYSCPIVPLENDLKTAILAGVKKFHD